MNSMDKIVKALQGAIETHRATRMDEPRELESALTLARRLAEQQPVYMADPFSKAAYPIDMLRNWPASQASAYTVPLYAAPQPAAPAEMAGKPITQAEIDDILLACGELAAAMNHPAIICHPPQTLTSQTIRLAAGRLKTRPAAPDAERPPIEADEARRELSSLLMAMAVIRELTKTQQGSADETIEAVRAALAAAQQPAQAVALSDEQIMRWASRHDFDARLSLGDYRAMVEDARTIEFEDGITQKGEHG